MFELFNRKKIKSWEIELLRSALIKMPKYHLTNLLEQISDNLFKGVIVNASDIVGHVAFTFNGNVVSKYENQNARSYILSNIKVFDKKTSTFLKYDIFVSSGMISGYTIGESNKKCNIDFDRIDVSEMAIIFWDNLDYNRIKNIFSDDENGLINPDNVYSIMINDKEYFHIKDLEDGNFIGVDLDKNVFEIHHDSEIIKIQKSIADILAAEK